MKDLYDAEIDYLFIKSTIDKMKEEGLISEEEYKEYLKAVAKKYGAKVSELTIDI